MIVYRSDPDFVSPVTRDEVKANARVLHDDENDLIDRLIQAAHERAEQETGLAFGPGEFVIETDTCGDDILLPVWPVASVVSIMNGSDTITDYTISRPMRYAVLSANEWPDSVVITVQAGMEMPNTVRQAIIVMATYWYDQRSTASVENVREVPYAATALLGLNRRMFA